MTLKNQCSRHSAKITAICKKSLHSAALAISDQAVHKPLRYRRKDRLSLYQGSSYLAGNINHSQDNGPAAEVSGCLLHHPLQRVRSLRA